MMRSFGYAKRRTQRTQACPGSGQWKVMQMWLKLSRFAFRSDKLGQLQRSRPHANAGAQAFAFRLLCLRRPIPRNYGGATVF